MNTVIGYRNVNFTKDGKDIKGIKLHTTIEGDTANGITGKGCEELFLSAEKFPDFKPQLSQKIDIRYNKFGKVESVKAVG